MKLISGADMRCHNWVEMHGRASLPGEIFTTGADPVIEYIFQYPSGFRRGK
jgi:hypothetical protein